MDRQNRLLRKFQRKSLTYAINSRYPLKGRASPFPFVLYSRQGSSRDLFNGRWKFLSSMVLFGETVLALSMVFMGPMGGRCAHSSPITSHSKKGPPGRWRTWGSPALLQLCLAGGHSALLRPIPLCGSFPRPVLSSLPLPRWVHFSSSRPPWPMAP